MRRTIFPTFLVLFFGIQLSSAQNNLNSNYSKNPEWIQMMDNPNVNYYEAVKAYNEYWKNPKMNSLFMKLKK